MDNINEKIQEVLKANLYEDWEELMEKWNNVYFEVWQDIMKVIGSSLVIEFMERPEAESIMIIIRNNHIVHKLHEHLLLNEFVELIKSLETQHIKTPEELSDELINELVEDNDDGKEHIKELQSQGVSNKDILNDLEIDNWSSYKAGYISGYEELYRKINK